MPKCAGPVSTMPAGLLGGRLHSKTLRSQRIPDANPTSQVAIKVCMSR